MAGRLRDETRGRISKNVTLAKGVQYKDFKNDGAIAAGYGAAILIGAILGAAIFGALGGGVASIPLAIFGLILGSFVGFFVAVLIQNTFGNPNGWPKKPHYIGLEESEVTNDPRNTATDALAITEDQALQSSHDGLRAIKNFFRRNVQDKPNQRLSYFAQFKEVLAALGTWVVFLWDKIRGNTLDTGLYATTPAQRPGRDDSGTPRPDKGKKAAPTHSAGNPRPQASTATAGGRDAPRAPRRQPTTTTVTALPSALRMVAANRRDDPQPKRYTNKEVYERMLEENGYRYGNRYNARYAEKYRALSLSQPDAIATEAVSAPSANRMLTLNMRQGAEVTYTNKEVYERMLEENQDNPLFPLYEAAYVAKYKKLAETKPDAIATEAVRPPRGTRPPILHITTTSKKQDGPKPSARSMVVRNGLKSQHEKFTNQDVYSRMVEQNMDYEDAAPLYSAADVAKYKKLAQKAPKAIASEELERPPKPRLKLM